MLWGSFHKQGDGGFTSGRTEIENRPLKTMAVAVRKLNHLMRDTTRGR